MLYQLDILEHLFQLNLRNTNAQKDIEKHLNDFQKLYNEIKIFQGIQIPKAYYIYGFLRSLPEMFNSFSRSYDNVVECFSLSEVMSSLRADNIYRSAHSSYKTGDSRSPPVALNASASQSHQAKGKKGKGNNKQKDKRDPTKVKTALHLLRLGNACHQGLQNPPQEEDQASSRSSQQSGNGTTGSLCSIDYLPIKPASPLPHSLPSRRRKTL